MIDTALADRFARVALANVTREYPRKLDQLLAAPPGDLTPRAIHPAFYGSYDWHSAVHMHWLLVRLLRLHPDLPSAASTVAVLDTHLAQAPLAYEPSQADFLSPILTEAQLMREVLPEQEFRAWFAGFLPAGFGSLLEPVVPPDRGDPQFCHLDGLSLSRAWALRRLAAVVPAGVADRHLAAGLPQAVDGDYVGEHWLASFAALALCDAP